MRKFLLCMTRVQQKFDFVVIVSLCLCTVIILSFLLTCSFIQYFSCFPRWLSQISKYVLQPLREKYISSSLTVICLLIIYFVVLVFNQIISSLLSSCYNHVKFYQITTRRKTLGLVFAESVKW